MMVAVTLLLLGLIAVWLEFYIPGGVLAIVGALCILASIWCFSATDASPYAIAVFLGVVIASLIAVIRLALWRIRKSAEQNSFYLGKDQEGYVASKIDATLVGKEGVTLTDLGPGGFVLIDGAKYPATCKGPYLDKGSKIVVQSFQNAYLIVKPLKTEET